MSENPLRDMLAELKGLAEKANVDISRELADLEMKMPATPSAPENGAWRRVELARHPERPTTLQYAEKIFDDFTELHGDRTFGDDMALVGGIALLNGMPVTFFGHQKGQNMKENLKRNFGMAHPEGYRKALRLAHQAAKFGRPIISFIDTPGAYPGVSGEERGISQAIALNMKEFAILPVPIIATILGEGGSGGAIGIGVADIVLMMENAYYSVITPEGCASILLQGLVEGAGSRGAAEAHAAGPPAIQGGGQDRVRACGRRAQGPGRRRGGAQGRHPGFAERALAAERGIAAVPEEPEVPEPRASSSRKSRTARACCRD